MLFLPGAYAAASVFVEKAETSFSENTIEENSAIGDIFPSSVCENELVDITVVTDYYGVKLNCIGETQTYACIRLWEDDTIGDDPVAGGEHCGYYPIDEVYIPPITHTFENIDLGDEIIGDPGDYGEFYVEIAIDCALGLPIETASEDVYGYVNGECDCLSGACCDLSSRPYDFKSSSFVCDSEYDFDYGCPDGAGTSNPGEDVFKRIKQRNCSGFSASCSGTITNWLSWFLFDSCSSDEYCSDDDPSCNSCGYHTNYTCYDSDVYWYDNCSNLEDKKQECGSDYCDSWGSWYCSSSSQRKRDRTCYDKGCSSSSCFNNSFTDYETENCPSGTICSGGSCIVQEIECYNNSDCGTDGFIGSEFCSNEDVYQTWRTFTCNNPGTTLSYCSQSDSDQKKTECGDDSYSDNYCFDNDVYRDFTDKGCSGAGCFETIVQEKIEECEEWGCNGGECNAPNSEPTTPTALLCDGEPCSNNGSFFDNIEINCSGSIDAESDAITYFIDANYNHTSTIDDSINTFSNSLETENLTFSGDENITRYLEVPRNADVTKAYLYLSNKEFEEEDSQLSYNAGFSLYSPGWWTRTGQKKTIENRKIKKVGFHFDKWNLPYTPFGNVNFTIRRVSDDSLIQTKTWGDASDLSTVKSWYFVEFNNPPIINEEVYILAEYYGPQGIEFFMNGSNVKENENMVRWNGSYTSLSTWDFVYQITYETEILNPYLEIGTLDGIYEWNHIGEFNATEQTADFSLAINSALNNGACDCEGCVLNGDYCLIPFLFHSDSPGILEYSDINVTYQAVLDGYFWENIGSHPDASVLDWNISNITEQSGVDLRCRAIDLEGSNLYSDYYDPSINITILEYTLIGCGDTITQNTILTEDLLNCPGHGLVIGADDITVDCNGYVIEGDYSGAYKSGIYIFKNRVNVKNCNLKGFSYGIQLYYGSDNNFTHNILNNNTNDGINFLINSKNNTISGNIISDNGRYGVYLRSGSEYNTFWDNNFSKLQETIGVTLNPIQAILLFMKYPEQEMELISIQSAL